MIHEHSGHAIALAVLISIAGCVSADTPIGQVLANTSLITSIRTIKKSVAPVACINVANGTESLQGIAGTAFFISQSGIFITPAHVIKLFKTGGVLANCTVPMVYFAAGQWQGTSNYRLKWFRFRPEQCIVDENFDLAKCATVANLLNPKYSAYRPEPVTIDDSIKDAGVSVAFTGFPLENVTPLTSVGIIGGYVMDNTVGIPYGKLMIDKAAWPGASGSPVYSAGDAHVVGMIIQTGTGMGAGIAYGRTGIAISTFLKAHPANPPQQQTDQK